MNALISRTGRSIFKLIVIVLAMIGAATIISMAMPASAVVGAAASQPLSKTGVAANPQILEPESEYLEGYVIRIQAFANPEITGCRAWIQDRDGNSSYHGTVLVFTTSQNLETLLALAYDNENLMGARVKKRTMPVDYEWHNIHVYADTYFELEDVILP